MQGVLAAAAALYGPIEPISADDAMAERERIRIEDEEKKRRQGELRLVSKGRL